MAGTNGHPNRPVELNRRFRSTSTEEADQAQQAFNPGNAYLGWDDLYAYRRIIILAEAGGGKSNELEAQWLKHADEGKCAFRATVQDVAKLGLEAALGRNDGPKLAAFRADPDAHCVFFIDSIDEAKNLQLTFTQALRNIASGIAGYEERTTVVISGRYTDWDFKVDIKAAEEWLSIPKAPGPQGPQGPPGKWTDALISSLHNRSEDKNTAQEDDVKVVVMVGLDRERVRMYAAGLGLNDIDGLLEAIEKNNLWHFASRPMDLDWMIQYWRTNGKLGKLAAMIEESLTERLKEPKASRQATDDLSPERAGYAIDRVGAAFVFAQSDSILVPSDEGDLGRTEKSIPLEPMLPDWGPGEVAKLRSRPVFDPATLGRARLHNDNEGTIRAYLTARWLKRLLASNCPPQTVHDLLFRDLYGFSVVRPDMDDVAAWLALTDEGVANELLARSPIDLILRGDPSSLPVSVRANVFEAALKAAVEQNARLPWVYDRDAVARFGDPRLDPYLAGWWATYSYDREARILLLQLIKLAEQKGGVAIAEGVALDAGADTISAMLAGDALMSMGSAEAKALYADHIKSNFTTLERSVVVKGLGLLFPDSVSVNELFAFLDAIGLEDGRGDRGLYPLTAELSPQLTDPVELEHFINSVIARAAPLSDERDDDPIIDAFARVSVTAAERILADHPDDVPESVVALLLHLRNPQRGHPPEEAELGNEFGKSEGRRRTSMWSAVSLLRDHTLLNGGLINIWQLEHLGLPNFLTIDDIPWLLDDSHTREAEDERRLAFSTACALWSRAGRSDKILQSLREASVSDTSNAATLEQHLSPPPSNPEMEAMERRWAESREESKRRSGERDKSWVDFIQSLRDDPTVLDNLNPQTENTADSRLVHLWQLVSSRMRSAYAIDDLTFMEPILGAEVTRKLHFAMVGFANNHQPKVYAEKGPDEQNRQSSFDTLGLAGTALAAAADPNWESRLNSNDATRAAKYATIELNGFPDFLLRLAKRWPSEVAAVLWADAETHLRRGGEHHGMLDRLEYADPLLSTLLLPELTEWLLNPDVGEVALEKLATLVIRSAKPPAPELAARLPAAIGDADTTNRKAYLLSVLFALSPDNGLTALRSTFEEQSKSYKRELMKTLLPRMFGGWSGMRAPPDFGLSLPNLEELLLMAFDGLRPEDDIHRPPGVVFSPGPEDDAPRARDAIFYRIANTPGEATAAMLRRFAEIPDFPFLKDQLLKMAKDRAREDSRLPVWKLEDVVQFERDFDAPPTNTSELLLLAQRRIELIQHDLLTSKFAQGRVLQGIPNENLVQYWIADRLDNLRRKAYTVEREAAVADDKEPDVTLTSQSATVQVPIEIKVVDDMSVPEIEAALHTQLCAKYLRNDTARRGMLLLVHQNARPVGWTLNGKAGVSWAEVLEHMHNVARAAREAEVEGPQPVIGCLDVSSLSEGKKAGGKGSKNA